MRNRFMEHNEKLEDNGFENFEDQERYRSVSDDIEREVIRCIKRSKGAMKIALLMWGFLIVWNYVIVLVDKGKGLIEMGFVAILFMNAICFAFSLVYAIMAYIKKKTKVTEEILIMNLAIIVGVGGMLVFLAWVIVF